MLCYVSLRNFGLLVITLGLYLRRGLYATCMSLSLHRLVTLVCLSHQPTGAHCQAAPLVMNASLEINVSSRSISFTCWPDHRFADLSLVKVIKCNQDNGWDYAIGHCSVIVCPAFPPPLNGSLSTNAVIRNTVVTVQCNLGFVFDDGETKKFLMCQDSRNWNASTNFKCEPIFCHDVPVISNATLTAGLEWRLESNGLFPFDAKLQFTCLEGQKFLEGQTKKIISCNETGNWNYDTQLNCDYGRCDPVPEFDHSRANSSSATRGVAVGYTCNLGYKSTAAVSMETVCDGHSWSPLQVECNVIFCPAPNVTNAQLNATDNVYGTQLLVSCFHGYQLKGGEKSAVVVCAESGQWSSDIHCDGVDCGSVPMVMNSEVTTSSPTTYGTNVTFTCFHGYWFSRGVFSTMMTCGAGGKWVGDVLTSCTYVWCPSLAPRILSTTNTSVDTVVNISCLDNQWLTNGQKSMLSKCSAAGLWTPEALDCADFLITDDTAIRQIFEAKYSSVIGIVAAILVAILFACVIAFDLPIIKVSTEFFARNFCRTFDLYRPGEVPKTANISRLHSRTKKRTARFKRKRN